MTAFSCFVTGTDTGVGKTLVTSALVHSLARKGIRTVGMKPVAAGASLENGEWRNEDTDSIIAASSIMLSPALVTPYLLKTAASPHIAAAIENTTIEWETIRKCHAQLGEMAESVVIEGAGGFIVPLSEELDTADLAQRFGLPVILVVGLRLGCISHALLTAEAILSRGLTLAGWVANHIDPTMPYDAENIRTLEQRIMAPRIATIPYIRDASIIEAARYLDLSKLNIRQAPEKS